MSDVHSDGNSAENFVHLEYIYTQAVSESRSDGNSAETLVVLLEYSMLYLGTLVSLVMKFTKVVEQHLMW